MTAFETCGAGVVNENSGSYTKTSHAMPVLFTSSAIHDQVGVEDVLVELAREVMPHVCAAVAIAPQRRTSRRPLTIGPTARSRSAPGMSFVAEIEQIQRKSRVRERTPQNAPRTRAGVKKKDQKAELKKNQTRRRYVEKKKRFFSDDRQTPARREARNH